jgi:iron complex transport system permease protein
MAYTCAVYPSADATLEQAQAANVWLTGSLNGRGWEHVRPVAVALAILLPATALLARRLRPER